MISIRSCLFALLALLTVFPARAGAAEAGKYQSIQLNKIAAVINGEMITLHELRQHTGPELARAGIRPSDPAARQQIEALMTQVLDSMIDDMLLRQEATRLKVTVSDNEVDNELRKLVQRNQTTMAEFEARVVAQGGTMAMVKERLRNNILNQRIVSIMIARKIVITQDEIARYYEEHQKEFAAEKSVNLSLIVFGPAAKPADVLRRINEGSLSFAEAAKQYSIGPAPDKGGELGLIAWKDMAEPIKVEVLKLQNGQVSGIFQLNMNDSLVKLNSSTAGRQMTLEEATPEIERILREPRMRERFTEYTQQLRKKAVIDIRL